MDRIKDWLNSPKVHRCFALLIGLGGILAPAQYQPYIISLAAVLGALGYALPDSTQKKVEALIDAHVEAVTVVTQIAEGQGIDTSAMRAAIPPASPVIGKPWIKG